MTSGVSAVPHQIMTRRDVLVRMVELFEHQETNSVLREMSKSYYCNASMFMAAIVDVGHEGSILSGVKRYMVRTLSDNKTRTASD